MSDFRRYRTDYAGVWHGHCKTRESAIVAAVRKVINDQYSSATITDRETDVDIARVRQSKDRKQAIVTVTEPFIRVRR